MARKVLSDEFYLVSKPRDTEILRRTALPEKLCLTEDVCYFLLMSKRNPFKYFKTSPEIIKLAVMYYVRFPLSLRQAQDILHERGIDVCHETVRFWWRRFGPIFAKALRKRKLNSYSLWRWHLDEVFVKINGERHYLWRALLQKLNQNKFIPVSSVYYTDFRRASSSLIISAITQFPSPKARSLTTSICVISMLTNMSLVLEDMFANGRDNKTGRI